MKYVVLFRGINVGGKNIVKMSDLKQLLLELGLCKVTTYIQSGNAIFESDLDEASLKDAIHTAFSERYRFECNIFIRNIDELVTIIEHLPISTEEIAAAESTDPLVEHLYVYFLDSLLEQTQVDAILKEYAGPDILRTGRRELYLLCQESIRNSKLALRTAKEFNLSTTRNWKTVSKIYEMLTAL
jgi:uncharacterized protein (DUF1697 family)